MLNRLSIWKINAMLQTTSTSWNELLRLTDASDSWSHAIYTDHQCSLTRCTLYTTLLFVKILFLQSIVLKKMFLFEECENPFISCFNRIARATTRSFIEMNTFSQRR